MKPLHAPLSALPKKAETDKVRMGKSESKSNDGDASSAHLRGTLGVRAVYTFAVLGIMALGVLVIMWLISARMSKWTTVRLLAGTDKTGPYPALAFVALGLAVFAFLIAAVAYKALQGFAIFAVMALVVLLIGCTITAVVLMMMTNKQITNKTLNPTKFDQWQTYVRIAAWITTGVFVGFVVVLFAKYLVGEKAARKAAEERASEEGEGAWHESSKRGSVGVSADYTSANYTRKLEELQQVEKESLKRSQKLEETNRQLIAQSTERAVQDAERAAALAQQAGLERQAAEADLALVQEAARRRQVSETLASVQLALQRAEEQRKQSAAMGLYAQQLGYTVGNARVNEDNAQKQTVRAGFAVGASRGAAAADENIQGLLSVAGTGTAGGSESARTPPVPGLGV